jgi:hypothetical protein
VVDYIICLQELIEPVAGDTVKLLRVLPRHGHQVSTTDVAVTMAAN